MTFQPTPYRLAFASATSSGGPDLGPVRAQARPRPPRGIALGNEPPLDSESPVAAEARHGLSFRWLWACVLTAFAGMGLLGSAIYVSSEGELTFAELAEPAPAVASKDGGSTSGGMRKGDKLIRAETVASAKQTARAPMTLRSNEREVIKVRSFTRIATALSLSTGVYATNIPAFNPMRFFAAQDGDKAPETPAEASDADVAVVKTDLSAMMGDPGGPALSDEDASVQVEAELRAGDQAARGSGPSLSFPTFLPRAFGPHGPQASDPAGLFPRAGDAAFRSIEVRVVPENVTSLPKASARAGDLAFEDRVVQVRRGEPLEATLRSGGATADETAQIIRALGARERGVDGMNLRLLLAPPAAAGQPRAVVRAVLYGERGVEAIAAMNDRGSFVSVAPPPVEGAKPQGKAGGQDEDEEEQEGTGARLYESLYETALKYDIPRQTVEELVRVFGYDVDFQRRVAAGDSLEIFYAADEEGGQERIELLSANLTIGQEVHRIYRYQGDDGAVDYLDEAGRSLKKFLVRKPIGEARMSSGFGTRIHPLLGYGKAHMGVDWAAKIGTPILAAGNGTVLTVGWNMGGYGRRIEIQHANGYVTTYNHQSAFAKGIAPGVRVRQGQVIGFVGSTGLSTGPHLHYEVMVNGRFVDPMKIRVPRGRELDGRALADFAKQRDQIESLAKRAGGSSQIASGESR